MEGAGTGHRAVRHFLLLMSTGSCTCNLGTTCQGSTNKKCKMLERRPRKRVSQDSPDVKALS